MWWTVPKVWENGTCVIIGGGPSIIEQFGIPEQLVQQVRSGCSPAVYSPYLEQLHTQHVIAVNIAFRIGRWMDIIFFGDADYGIKYIDEMREQPGLLVSCVPKGTDPHNMLTDVKYLMRNNKKIYGITEEPNQVSWNKNSGSCAINLAVHTGVKRIILLGFDMSLDENRNQHWHKEYSLPKDRVDKFMAKHCEGFPTMAQDLKHLGVEVLNCSPKSKIEEFPKVNFKDIKL